MSPEALREQPADDDPAVTALDVLSADAAVSLVRACLPPDQAAVILLRVLGGLDVNEVAAIVGKRPGNVRCPSSTTVYATGQADRVRGTRPPRCNTMTPPDGLPFEMDPYALDAGTADVS